MYDLLLASYALGTSARLVTVHITTQAHASQSICVHSCNLHALQLSGLQAQVSALEEVTQHLQQQQQQDTADDRKWQVEQQNTMDMLNSTLKGKSIVGLTLTSLHTLAWLMNASLKHLVAHALSPAPPTSYRQSNTDLFRVFHH